MMKARNDWMKLQAMVVDFSERKRGQTLRNQQAIVVKVNLPAYKAGLAGHSPVNTGQEMNERVGVLPLYG